MQATSSERTLSEGQKRMVFGLALVIVAGVFIQFFYSVEATGRLAFDRRILHGAMQDWTYGTGMSNPPWSMVLVYPFEQLPLNLTWGLLAYLLFLVLIAWIPPYKGWTRYVLLFVLPLSWITLRNYAEGNYEAFVLWGLLFIWLGVERRTPWLLAVGVLLATIKPQLCALLLVLLPLYVRHWHYTELLEAGGIVLAVVIPAMVFKGQEWIDSLGYFADDRGTQEFFGFEMSMAAYTAFRVMIVLVSLSAGLQRTRVSFALLVSASLLISPYIGGLSMVTIMGVSVGAIFAAGWWLMGFLFLVAFQDLLTLSGNAVDGYWSLILLTVWLTLLVMRTFEIRRAPSPEPVAI